MQRVPLFLLPLLLSCAAGPPEGAGDLAECEDGWDNDGDGSTDCDDEDCSFLAACSGDGDDDDDDGGWFICAHLVPEGIEGRCDSGCAADRWLSAGPFPTIPDCMDVLSGGQWPGVPGGGWIRFDDGEVNGSMVLQASSGPSADLQPVLTGVTSLVLPEGRGVTQAFAPPDGFGSAINLEDDWLSIGLRAAEPPGVLEIVPNPEGFEFADPQDLEPRQVRVHFSGGDWIASGTLSLVSHGAVTLGDTVSHEATWDVSGMTLTNEEDSYDASGILDTFGSAPMEGPWGPPVQPGDSALIGLWDAPPSNNCGGQHQIIQFRSDQGGRVWIPDCTNQCAQSDNYYDFDWSTTDAQSGTVSWTYSSAVLCGTAQDTPSPYSAPFSLSADDNQVTIDGTTWTRSSAAPPG